jgi:hypothetical protein
MVRKTRVVLAAVLAVAVAAVPLMLEQCSAVCEAHHDSVASTPTCHHTGTTTAFHLGHAPNSCGHDHNGTLVTADNGLTPTSRPFVASVAVVAIPVNPAVAISQHLRTHAPPGTASTLLDGRSLPLRI